MSVTFKRKKMGGPVPLKPGTPAPKGRPAGSAFQRITDLGEERVGLLNSLFLEGKPIGTIIETLQDGWKVFTDTKKETLKKYLYRYKWEVVDKGLFVAQVLETESGDKKFAMVKDVLENFDVLLEMKELTVVQKGRVQKMLKREAEMPMLFGSLGNEMKTYASFLQQLAEISFDLGMLKRVPNVTKITGKDGHVTTVESEGREHVALSLAAEKDVEKAAETFFKVLEDFEHAQQL